MYEKKQSKILMFKQNVAKSARKMLVKLFLGVRGERRVDDQDVDGVAEHGLVIRVGEGVRPHHSGRQSRHRSCQPRR